MFSNTTACLLCIRDLHTVFTYEGIRILDLELYVKDAYREYCVEARDLSTYRYVEMEWLLDYMSNNPPHSQLPDTPWAAPPHHRF